MRFDRRWKELPSRGLDPRVHVFIGMHASKTWVAGTSPATGGQEKDLI